MRSWGLHPLKDPRSTLEEGVAQATLGREPGGNLSVPRSSQTPTSKLGLECKENGSWLFALSQSTICPYSVKAKGSVRCQGVSYLREEQCSHTSGTHVNIPSVILHPQVVLRQNLA